MKHVKYFLAKTDPDTYTLAQLKADVVTNWDGVTNPQALQAIRAMQPRDRVLIYHSGGESALVGLAEVVSLPEPDPNNPKSAFVRMKFLLELPFPTTLKEVKAQPQFAEFLLVRNSRLSTMPVPDNFIDWLRGRYPKVKL